jgi:hypothetical protein
LFYILLGTKPFAESISGEGAMFFQAVREKPLVPDVFFANQYAA